MFIMLLFVTSRDSKQMSNDSNFGAFHVEFYATTKDDDSIKRH